MESGFWRTLGKEDGEFSVAVDLLIDGKVGMDYFRKKWDKPKIKRFESYVKNYEQGRQEAKECTVIRRLRRYKKRNVRPSPQDIQEIAEDSNISIERVYELAKEDHAI